ncbi:tyrosine-type recombinase/integrase [Tsukamurella tyrosinosolvens]|uniref:tyrosine-type recombinase/integrase n=1 Tax=Tsukamurella tyrosinosolvens TaxID=57704 RepID=UPI001AFBCA62|nr:tyrosine-type recombinase/integrase [Tsukamurella tyrosinosolvens]QRY85752.1 tyrosine-type recombinase/integrase [Tsukamurella tyrosinosolvens]
MSSSFGTVRKLPSGRYQARYYVPSAAPGPGDRRTAPHTFPTKRAAHDWLAAQRVDMLRGDWRDPNAGMLPFGTFAAEHLATRVDLAPRTADLYAEHLARFVDAELTGPTGATIRLGATALRDIDLPLIRAWHAAVTAASARSATARAKRPTGHPARTWARAAGYDVAPTGRLSPAILDAWHAAGRPTPAPVATGYTGRTTAAQAYRMVRMLLTAAVADGHIRTNPAKLPRVGSTRAAERIPATPAQVRALAEAMPEHLAAAVHLAAWTGLRAGELFALDRSRVDLAVDPDRPELATGTVRVDRALTTRRGKVTGYGPPKTESSYRTVHLPPHVAVLLAAHIDENVPRRADALLFTGPGGRPVSPSLRTKTFARARAVAGREDLRWHDLRHTGATLAAQTGASVRELQHRLGHATVSAAMLYQHHTAERDRALAARLSELAASSTGAAPTATPAPSTGSNA